MKVVLFPTKIVQYSDFRLSVQFLLKILVAINDARSIVNLVCGNGAQFLESFKILLQASFFPKLHCNFSAHFLGGLSCASSFVCL